MRRMVTGGSRQERRSAPESLSINSRGARLWGSERHYLGRLSGQRAPVRVLWGGRQGRAITTSLPAVRSVRLGWAGVNGYEADRRARGRVGEA